MRQTRVLLLKAVVGHAEDAALLGALAALRQILNVPFAEFTAYRGLRTPDLYAYCVLEGAGYPADRDLRRLETQARELPELSSGVLRVDRLERVFPPTGASAGKITGFRYVVETDAAEGWEDELSRWYDAEHMPGLAAVPGCVDAQRFINRDAAPHSHACYDLTDPKILESSAWLAVRRTAWSDRIRPQFQNTRRTLFRSLRFLPANSAVKKARHAE